MIQPETAARRTASSDSAPPPAAPLDRLDVAPPTIPTRITTPEDPTIAFAAAVRRAHVAARPVHRSQAPQVAAGIASVLCFPGDFLHAQSETFDRLVDQGASAIARLWQQGGFMAFLAVVVAVLTALPLLFIKGLSLGANLIELPFRALRFVLTEIGRAAANEQAVRPADANFRRIDRSAWPRHPMNRDVDAAVARYVRGQNEFAGAHYPTDLLIVPGYADAHFAGALHPRAIARLHTAADDFAQGRTPFILVSGGNVHPEGTPFNEATEMRRYLIETLKVPPERIILEPLARHSPTNVRNAGRYMVQNGLVRAQIVSDSAVFGQPMIFNVSHGPFFGVDFRSIFDNGVSFGSYARVDSAHTGYVPSEDVMLARTDAEGHTLDDD